MFCREGLPIWVILREFESHKFFRICIQVHVRQPVDVNSYARLSCRIGMHHAPCLQEAYVQRICRPTAKCRPYSA